MTPDLEPRRRALAIVYRRYLVADRALHVAQEEALAWFPAETRPAVLPIGHPGSPIRRLRERRDRLLDQLAVARIKLHVARRRAILRRLALPRY